LLMDGRVRAAGRSQPTASYRHSTSFLSRVTPLNIALIVLNVEGGRELLSELPRFEHLWQRSSLRLCADGAANRLYDSADEPSRSEMIPDIITGDLDSLRGDVAEYYAGHGVAIKGVADQDAHDFEKCLRWLQRQQASDAIAASMGTPELSSEGRGGAAPAATSLMRTSGGSGSSTTMANSRSSGGESGLSAGMSKRARCHPFSVVAYGAFGGRLDQQMANLNMVYSYDCFHDFFLVSERSLAFLLRPGTHVIEPNRQAEDGTCGLIPLGGRCEGVRTTGLKWNLDGERALEFGELISSSNEIVGDHVTVQTSSPLLWTTGLR